MEHYFSDKPEVGSKLREIRYEIFGKKLILMGDSGVFSKDHLDLGSKLLIETVIKELGCLDINKDEEERKIKDREKISGLDLGCGYGPIGISLAKFCKLKMTFIDVNERAVRLTSDNIRRVGLNNAKVICADGLKKIDEHYDVIVTNPPIRAGKQTIYRLFKEAIEHLKPNGQLFIVIRKQQGAASAVNYLKALESDVESVDIVTKKDGYWILKVRRQKR